MEGTIVTSFGYSVRTTHNCFCLLFNRWLADLASQVIYYLGSYNLITASCQTFSDNFLKELGSCGYSTYVKTAIAGAAVVGAVATVAGLLYWLTSSKEDKK